jgi:hypothetical protein
MGFQKYPVAARLLTSYRKQFNTHFFLEGTHDASGGKKDHHNGDYTQNNQVITHIF